MTDEVVAMYDSALLDHIPRLTEGVGNGRNFHGMSLPNLSLQARQQRPLIYAKPAIFVVSEKAVDFAGGFVNFSVQVFNVPQGCSLNIEMLEAIAETPSGRQIRCVIGAGITLCGFIDTFHGSFWATDEVGLYLLRVRMILPFKYCQGFADNFGIATDIVNILICRNYSIECKKLSRRVQCGNVPNVGWKAWGLACDRITNRIYITELNNDRVTCMDSTGKILFYFDQHRRGSRLNRPTGICCDHRNRRVLLCDKDHHRVCIFDVDGKYISSFGRFGFHDGMLNFPWDIDVNPSGTYIVVSDSKNRRIQLFDKAGTFIDKFSIYGQGPLNYHCPRAISFDSDGQLIYVIDSDTASIVQIPMSLPFHTARRLVPEELVLLRPQGLVLDPTGCMLLADSRSNCVYHLNGEGEHLGVIRSVGAELLESPVNVTLMQGGAVAVLGALGSVHIVLGSN